MTEEDATRLGGAKTGDQPVIVASLEARLGRIDLGEDGIVRTVLRNVAEHTLDLAREQIEAYRQIGDGKPMLVFADIRAVTVQADRDARAYYASEDGSRYTKRLALLVGSDLTKMLANFFFRFHKPSYAMRMFTDEAEALAWLAEAPN